MEDRFRKRLISWKSQYISKGGGGGGGGGGCLGLCLFVALYLIYLSIFYHSFEFRNRLDLDWRRFKEFLWGGGNLEKKPHLVNWATVCTMKKKGGLRPKKILQS